MERGEGWVSLISRWVQTHTTTQFLKWNRVDPCRGDCWVGSDSEQPHFRQQRNLNKASYIFLSHLFSNETKWPMSIVPKMRSTTISIIHPSSIFLPSPNLLYQRHWSREFLRVSIAPPPGGSTWLPYSLPVCSFSSVLTALGHRMVRHFEHKCPYVFNVMFENGGGG